jgi:hypothetical protein
VLHLRRKARLGYGCFTFLIRLRLRFLSALRLLAGRFGVRGTEDPIDLRSPCGYDLSLLALYERVSVCVCSRLSMTEGAGDSAETPRHRLRIRSESVANSQRPSVLRHLSSIHWARVFSGRLAVQAREGGTQGTSHGVERRRD